MALYQEEEEEVVEYTKVHTDGCITYVPITCHERLHNREKITKLQKHVSSQIKRTDINHVEMARSKISSLD